MSRAKAKGTRWESAVRDYLNRVPEWNVYRPAQEGFRDTGDLHGLPFVAAQCKDWRDVTGAVREGTDGVQVQARNAGKPLGVNFVKRARKGVAQGYAVMTVEQWAVMLYALNRADALLGDDIDVSDLIAEGFAELRNV